MKRPLIHSAFHMKGGWEGWFQVELALFLEQHGYTVKRDKQVFQGSLEAADLVVTSPQGICTIIELKCQSLPQDITVVQQPDSRTMPKFAVRIEEVIEKFGTRGWRVHDRYLGVFFCCVGISGTMNSTLGAVLRNGMVRPWFDGLSLDRLARFAVENGLMGDDSIDKSSTDNLLMWWSGVHHKRTFIEQDARFKLRGAC